MPNINLTRLEKSFSTVIRNWWGLVILLALLVIIFLTNFRFSTAILGWDNFSVSLDLKTNLSRTLFATWRDYRGFGVASDSEVVDIFRQLVLLPLDFLLPTQLVDQLYYFSLYVIGSISAFFLTREVVQQLSPNSEKKHVVQLAALTGALFYTFSLYTIDVFYLPLIMYIVRYAFFPLIILLFIRLLDQKKLDKKTLLLFVLVSILGTPSYLTATVFFTLLIIFATLLFSYPKKIIRYVSLLVIFLLLNSFWLLPFLNYTVQKASLLTKSATFALVNEFLFNQFAERFSWDKLLTFSSEFSSGLPFKYLSSGKTYPVHEFLQYTPIAERVAWYYYLPLPFIVLGLLFIIKKLLRGKLVGLWPVLLAAGSLFLLRKEYPPFGIVFDLLGEKIPPLKTVLRFGTTKMNPLLLIAFTVLVGCGVYFLFQLISKLKLRQRLSLENQSVKVLGGFGAIIVFLVISWMAYFPLKGKLLFPLLRASFPQEYYQVAETINNDQDHFRVLHVPAGQFSYWRSYKWGYYGSSFFNFILDKPLLDKTFSPANQNNDFYDFALNSVFQNVYALSDDELNNRAIWLQQLLKRAGVKYVVFDESVDSSIVVKNIKTWEYIQQDEVKQLLDGLAEMGALEIVQNKTIDLRTIAKIHGINMAQFDESVSENPNLILYQVNDIRPMVATVKEAVNLDPSFENAFVKPLYTEDITVVQTNNHPYRTYPFFNPRTNYSYDTEKILATFSHPKSGYTSLQQGDHVASSPFGVNVYVRPLEESLEVFGTTAQPTVNAQPTEEDVVFSVLIPQEQLTTSEPEDASYNSFLNNWHMLGDKQISSYRLEVGETILPLPSNFNEKMQYIGSVLMNPGDTAVTVLEKTEDSRSISPLAFRMPEEPNCLLDKTDGYQPQLQADQQVLSLSTINGSACVASTLQVPADSHYVEIEVSASQNSEGKAVLDQSFTPSQTQKAIERVVNELPNYHSFGVCIKNDVEGECLNNRVAINSNDPVENVRISSGKVFSGDVLQTIVILPKFEHSSNNLELSKVVIHDYVPVHTATVSAYFARANNSVETVSEPITSLEFPPVFSPSAHYMNPQVDALQPKERGECVLEVGDHRDSQIRLIKASPNGGLLSYISDCYQSVFVDMPYISEAFYLWTTDYHVYTGSQPQFIANESFQLVNEYVSYMDGYPNIPGMKSLQRADTLLPRSASYYDNLVKVALADGETVQGSKMLLAQGEMSKQGREFFEVHHTVANQALVEYRSNNVYALPVDWQNTYLENGTSDLEFASGLVSGVEKILPSLWKFNMEVGDSEQDAVLLAFGQAYDKQWHLYKTDSIWDVLLGRNKVSGDHLKVDGWSNGWIVSSELVGDESSTYFAFYAPERLAILGWVVTLVTIGGVLIYARKLTISGKGSAITHWRRYSRTRNFLEGENKTN